MSYIIGKTGQLIAKVGDRKSGESVLFSSQTCTESINANREKNLVNAHSGKISNAKKWDKSYLMDESCFPALEINPGEFLIHSCDEEE